MVLLYWPMAIRAAGGGENKGRGVSLAASVMAAAAATAPLTNRQQGRAGDVTGCHIPFSCLDNGHAHAHAPARAVFSCLSLSKSRTAEKKSVT